MSTRRVFQEGAITGIEDVRKYAADQKKLAGLLYHPFFKELRTTKPDGRYLEIGAGPGLLAVMIAEDNPRVNITAVDISPDMAAVAGEIIKERKLQDRVRYLKVDANDTETMQGLGKYDLVYSTFTMHHWNDPSGSISNLWENVADRGRLYIYDFKRVGWLYYLPFSNGDINSIRASFIPLELKKIVQDLGFTDFKIKEFFPFFFN